MLSFIYQELVGGAVFLVGLWLAFRSGELGARGRKGRLTAVLVGGLLFLALVQGLLQWAGRS